MLYILWEHENFTAPGVFFFFGKTLHTPKFKDENTKDISHKIVEDRNYIVRHFCVREVLQQIVYYLNQVIKLQVV